MARCASRFIAFFCLLSSIVSADDRVHFPTEDERRWNTPPQLTPETIVGKSSLDNNDSPQPRFLPFSASFTLSAGAGNAHSLSVGGSQDGLSFSQSASQAGNSVGSHGSGVSASQSSSFSAGLSGISAADSNSFNLNHPTFGNSQANSNAWALGQATSSAQGNVASGQATSSAQSGVGASQSSASSGAGAFATGQGQGEAQGQRQGHRQGGPAWTNIAPNYEIGGLYNPGGRPKLHVSQGQGQGHRRPSQRPLRLDINVDDEWYRRRPEVTITKYRPNQGHRQGEAHGHLQSSASSNSHENWSSSGSRESWTQSPLTGPQPGSWSQSLTSEKPVLQISGASASSSASSSDLGGSSFGQSMSHSNFGPNGPISWTNNNVQTTGNAQGHAQGQAAAVGQHSYGTQGSFSSGAIAGGSTGNGFSQGNSASGNRAGNSQGHVTSHSKGNGFVQGTANSGSVSFVQFPDENSQNIPKQFVRSRTPKNTQRRTSKSDDPVGEIISDITDTVVDLFDI